MIVQFEITTRCNFDCYYCVGRAMPQGDMTFQMFESLLDAHVSKYRVPKQVVLQGEGEPTLHKDFLKMVQKVRDIGSDPYTITNGTYHHPEHFVGLFNKVGVSVDTMDAVAAEKIGRYNLPRVLNFALALSKSGIQVFIHSVMSEDTPAVTAWCESNGLKQIRQPLQQKNDYVVHYGGAIVDAPNTPWTCRYPSFRYYDLKGLEMPCCFIKDTSVYDGIPSMVQHELDGTWPKACIGCRWAGA